MTPSLLLAVDTGKRKAGVSAWLDGVLVAAVRVDAPDAWRWSPRAMAEAILDRGASLLGGSLDGVHLVAELPRSYEARHAPERDLDALRRVAGALQRVRLLGGSYATIRPSAWKGQTPKHVTAHRVRGSLSDQEIERVDWSSHDAVDAAGIGLVIVGRASAGVVPAIPPPAINRGQ